ncbi:MAG: tRNA preQ1(34) S-adenosylmethionine ribosyltransferase-isomerase QueA [Polyangiaceae bacterium]|nr:tRNA preQ1(34) S-adenosylmethionine ribosyltransferase-isomerase QueA [Polyangiaceae bacterium]
MRLGELDYELPEELIAARPPAERDGGRLMVVARGGELHDRAITDLPSLLPAGALVVVNDTRVLPARVFARKPTGGRVEVLLLEPVGEPGTTVERWRALVRGSKSLSVGTRLVAEGACELTIEVTSKDAVAGTAELSLVAPAGVAAALEVVGHMPLPPYVARPDDAEDRERYQTVYAKRPGAVAAPTAGLHLSPSLLAALTARGVEVASVTLHVSLGTFQPVKVADLDDHPMHAERFEVGEAAAAAVTRARARGAPVFAIGTTSVRALESAADPGRRGHVVPSVGETRLLIQPGFRLSVVDGLLTNFHLPRSTLLALVSAMAGHERTMEAYRAAVARRYRFFSYGDAMLIEPRATR